MLKQMSSDVYCVLRSVSLISVDTYTELETGTGTKTLAMNAYIRVFECSSTFYYSPSHVAEVLYSASR